MSLASNIGDKAAGRIAVIGAGAAGLACAWRLAGAGLQVTVIEAGAPGRGALWASGGMLAAGFESAVELDGAHALAEPFARLVGAASDLWPGWVERIQAESGKAVGYERRGSLTPIFTAQESERAAAAASQARKLGIAVERLTAEQVREAEPSLRKSLGALSFPGDGQVDNRALGRALVEAAGRRGVDICSGRSAVSIETRGGRASAVILEDGAAVEIDAVVLAGGVSDIGGAPPQAAMIPVKGQMIAFAATRPLAPGRIVRGFSIYLAAKPGLRLVAGATSEPGKADLEIDDEATERLAAAARKAIPGLAGVPVVERWAGLRPRSCDAMPVIGEAAPGVFLAGGGYRNGVLLAPAIAEAVAAKIATGQNWPAAQPFAPDRAALSR